MLGKKNCASCGTLDVQLIHVRIKIQTLIPHDLTSYEAMLALASFLNSLSARRELDGASRPGLRGIIRELPAPLQRRRQSIRVKQSVFGINDVTKIRSPH